MKDEPPKLPSLDEFMKSDVFQAHVAESNSGITHDDFVAGVRSASLGVNFLCEPSQLLRGARHAPFLFYMLLYSVAPLIAIPIWAYHAGSWWLLLGIPVTYLAAILAAYHSKLINLFTCICIGVWIRLGFSIHQYITFYFICAIWGHIFFLCAEDSQRTAALDALIEDADLFDRAIAQNQIIIVHKDANVG